MTPLWRFFYRVLRRGCSRTGRLALIAVLLSQYAITAVGAENGFAIIVSVESQVPFALENVEVWVEENLLTPSLQGRVRVAQQPVEVAAMLDSGEVAEATLSIIVESGEAVDIPVTLAWRTARDGEYHFYLTRNVQLDPATTYARIGFYIDEASCIRRLERRGPVESLPRVEALEGTVSYQGSGMAKESLVLSAVSLVSVLVMESIWSSVEDRIWRYVDDLSASYLTDVWTYSGSDPWTVRDWLAWELDEHPNLIGCLFVGDVPDAWYEIPAHSGWEWDETFPTDLFYRDLDGYWGDADNDGLFDSHGGDTAPEIWIGRLKASNIGDEVQLINNYFDKNHAYRTWDRPVPYRALSYIDDDWKDSYDRNAVSEAYEDTTLVDDPEATTASDYKNRIALGYEWGHVMSHGWPGGHGFAENNKAEWYAVYSNEYLSSDWPVLFYNFFVCSGARYTESGYLAGSAVFPSNHGLLAVGSTKTGSMIYFYEFYGPLSNGRTVGDSFEDWWRAHMCPDQWFKDWAYGLTIIGDPTLTLCRPHKADVSQPYILGFKVPSMYSDSVTGDFSYSTTGWSASEANLQVTLAEGESIFLIGTAQVWNDYASIGSSIAITRDYVTRVSGDMFAAGASINSRELGVAIAVDSPGAGVWTYALSAKTDPGGRAWISQPYILGFKVSDIYSESVTGDFSYSTTSWSASPASVTVNLGAGESLFLVGTAQVWNDNPSVGSSIAITRDGTLVSGDMFAAGATITSRELAVAIAVDTSAGPHTYALSAKTDPGGKAWVSQPYILGFKVSNVYSDSATGDYYYTTTGWSHTDASFQVTMGSGESLFVIATSQLWNDYSSVGSSIAITQGNVRVSGDMFAAGATITGRELAVAIAVSTPGAGAWTYSLSAKTD